MGDETLWVAISGTSDPPRSHYTGQKIKIKSPFWGFNCTIFHHWQNGGSSSWITIGCLQIAKHKEVSKPEKTLSVSVSAISFIIPSLFILWSRMEWLKSQSERRQMKCFPPPSKESRPAVKSEVILFIQPSQAWRSVWPQTQAKSPQWFTGATWAWIMGTHGWESFIIFTQIIPFFPHLPERVWILYCVLKQKSVYKRRSPVCGNANERHLRPRHPQGRRRVTKQAGWNLPPVSDGHLHLYYGLFFAHL